MCLQRLCLCEQIDCLQKCIVIQGNGTAAKVWLWDVVRCWIDWWFTKALALVYAPKCNLISGQTLGYLCIPAWWWPKPLLATPLWYMFPYPLLGPMGLLRSAPAGAVSSSLCRAFRHKSKDRMLRQPKSPRTQPLPCLEMPLPAFPPTHSGTPSCHWWFPAEAQCQLAVASLPATFVSRTPQLSLWHVCNDHCGGSVWGNWRCLAIGSGCDFASLQNKSLLPSSAMFQ